MIDASCQLVSQAKCNVLWIAFSCLIAKIILRMLEKPMRDLPKTWVGIVLFLCGDLFSIEFGLMYCNICKCCAKSYKLTNDGILWMCGCTIINAIRSLSLRFHTLILLNKMHVLMQGLGNNSNDYVELIFSLKERGLTATVAEVSRPDWLRFAKGCLDRKCWSGKLSPRPLLDW